MKRVAMFVTNPCTHDARVMKEATTLSQNGFDVRVFALANAHHKPGVFEQDGYTVQRLKFDNIFLKAREIVWSTVAFLLAPIRWFKDLLSVVIRQTFDVFITILSGLGFVASAFLAIPTLLISKLFPNTIIKILVRAKNGTDSEDFRATAKSRSELFLLSLRYFRAWMNLGLRPRFKYENRRKIQKFQGKLYRLIRKLFLSVFKFPVRLPRKYYILSKSLIRKLYAMARSKVIAKTNKSIYHVLLPVHKISTYYFFCKVASVEAVGWGAQVAHAHDLNTMYAAHLVKKETGCSVVYDSHELWVHRNRVGRKANVEKIIDKIVEKRLIRTADAIITVCDSIGDWLEARYPNIPKPIILRNMPHRLEPDSEKGDLVSLKSRLNLPEESLVMIYTGKITSGRGLEVGMQALSEVDDLYMVLLGYGEQSYVDFIKSQATALNIDKKMIFCDPVPHAEVSQFIYGADFSLVYIEPVCLSYEFALPNKLFESIQAGVPILGSNLIEIERIVNEKKIGLCFSSPSDLANKIRTNANLSQLKEWRSAIRDCQAELCWDSEQSNLLQVYNSLAI